MPFNERRLRETYHVQFGVLIFHHAQDAVSEPREVRNTHFVQCAPDVIFNFSPPTGTFFLKAQSELRRSTATNAMHEQQLV